VAGERLQTGHAGIRAFSWLGFRASGHPPLRWEVTDDAGATESALAAIRRARDFLPIEQDPHFHRVLDDETALLEAAPTP